MPYDPANNFDDTLNEIVTALHSTLKIKGNVGVAFEDDGGRLTVSLPGGGLEAVGVKMFLKEIGMQVNPVRPGQLPLTVPDKIAKGKVK